MTQTDPHIDPIALKKVIHYLRDLGRERRARLDASALVETDGAGLPNRPDVAASAEPLSALSQELSRPTESAPSSSQDARRAVETVGGGDAKG